MKITLKKSQKTFIVLAVVSMLLGYLIIATTQTQIDTWREVLSESDPAFSIWMPNGAHQSVSEVLNEKLGKSFKTASIVSDENDNEYLLNITDYTELTDGATEDLFHSTLDLLTAAQDGLLVSYDDLGDTVDFTIIDKDGLNEEKGRMLFKNGYVFVQLVSSTEDNFDQEKYERFTTSFVF